MRRVLLPSSHHRRRTMSSGWGTSSTPPSPGGSSRFIPPPIGLFEKKKQAPPSVAAVSPPQSTTSSSQLQPPQPNIRVSEFSAPSLPTTPHSDGNGTPAAVDSSSSSPRRSTSLLQLQTSKWTKEESLRIIGKQLLMPLIGEKLQQLLVTAVRRRLQEVEGEAAQRQPPPLPPAHSFLCLGDIFESAESDGGRDTPAHTSPGFYENPFRNVMMIAAGSKHHGISDGNGGNGGTSSSPLHSQNDENSLMSEVLAVFLGQPLDSAGDGGDAVSSHGGVPLSVSILASWIYPEEFQLPSSSSSSSRQGFSMEALTALQKHLNVTGVVQLVITTPNNQDAAAEYVALEDLRHRCRLEITGRAFELLEAVLEGFYTHFILLAKGGAGGGGTGGGGDGVDVHRTEEARLSALNETIMTIRRDPRITSVEKEKLITKVERQKVNKGMMSIQNSSGGSSTTNSFPYVDETTGKPIMQCIHASSILPFELQSYLTTFSASSPPKTGPASSSEGVMTGESDPQVVASSFVGFLHLFPWIFEVSPDLLEVRLNVPVDASRLLPLATPPPQQQQQQFPPSPTTSGSDGDKTRRGNHYPTTIPSNSSYSSFTSSLRGHEVNQTYGGGQIYSPQGMEQGESLSMSTIFALQRKLANQAITKYLKPGGETGWLLHSEAKVFLEMAPEQPIVILRMRSLLAEKIRELFERDELPSKIASTVMAPDLINESEDKSKNRVLSRDFLKSFLSNPAMTLVEKKERILKGFVTLQDKFWPSAQRLIPYLPGKRDKRLRTFFASECAANSLVTVMRYKVPSAEATTTGGADDPTHSYAAAATDDQPNHSGRGAITLPRSALLFENTSLLLAGTSHAVEGIQKKDSAPPSHPSSSSSSPLPLPNNGTLFDHHSVMRVGTELDIIHALLEPPKRSFGGDGRILQSSSSNFVEIPVQMGGERKRTVLTESCSELFDRSKGDVEGEWVSFSRLLLKSFDAFTYPDREGDGSSVRSSESDFSSLLERSPLARLQHSLFPLVLPSKVTQGDEIMEKETQKVVTRAISDLEEGALSMSNKKKTKFTSTTKKSSSQGDLQQREKLPREAKNSETKIPKKESFLVDSFLYGRNESSQRRRELRRHHLESSLLSANTSSSSSSSTGSKKAGNRSDSSSQQPLAASFVLESVELRNIVEGDPTFRKHVLAKMVRKELQQQGSSPSSSLPHHLNFFYHSQEKQMDGITRLFPEPSKFDTEAGDNAFLYLRWRPAAISPVESEDYHQSSSETVEEDLLEARITIPALDPQLVALRHKLFKLEMEQIHFNKSEPKTMAAEEEQASSRLISYFRQKVKSHEETLYERKLLKEKSPHDPAFEPTVIDWLRVKNVLGPIPLSLDRAHKAHWSDLKEHLTIKKNVFSDGIRGKSRGKGSVPVSILRGNLIEEFIANSPLIKILFSMKTDSAFNWSREHPLARLENTVFPELFQSSKKKLHFWSDIGSIAAATRFDSAARTFNTVRGFVAREDSFASSSAQKKKNDKKKNTPELLKGAAQTPLEGSTGAWGCFEEEEGKSPRSSDDGVVTSGEEDGEQQSCENETGKGNDSGKILKEASSFLSPLQKVHHGIRVSNENLSQLQEKHYDSTAYLFNDLYPKWHRGGGDVEYNAGNKEEYLTPVPSSVSSSHLVANVAEVSAFLQSPNIAFRRVSRPRFATSPATTPSDDAIAAMKAGGEEVIKQAIKRKKSLQDSTNPSSTSSGSMPPLSQVETRTLVASSPQVIQTLGIPQVYSPSGDQRFSTLSSKIVWVSTPEDDSEEAVAAAVNHAMRATNNRSREEALQEGGTSAFRALNLLKLKYFRRDSPCLREFYNLKPLEKLIGYLLCTKAIEKTNTMVDLGLMEPPARTMKGHMVIPLQLVIDQIVGGEGSTSTTTSSSFMEDDGGGADNEETEDLLPRTKLRSLVRDCFTRFPPNSAAGFLAPPPEVMHYRENIFGVYTGNLVADITHLALVYSILSQGVHHLLLFQQKAKKAGFLFDQLLQSNRISTTIRNSFLAIHPDHASAVKSGHSTVRIPEAEEDDSGKEQQQALTEGDDDAGNSDEEELLEVGRTLRQLSPLDFDSEKRPPQAITSSSSGNGCVKSRREERLQTILDPLAIRQGSSGTLTDLDVWKYHSWRRKTRGGGASSTPTTVKA